MRLRAGAGWACMTALGVACAFAASAATTTACTTHQCDQSGVVNIDQTTGMFVGDVQSTGDGNVFWESSPIDGTWIDFPGMQTYYFTLPANFVPRGLPVPYIATGPNPDAPDGGNGTYVPAAGQLAEIGGYNCCGFSITNGTCAEYYLYVSVDGYFVAPPALATDDAGTGD